jgi:nucleoside-diphosphate-sugar epimerase
MPRVLLFGGSGYVGRSITNALSPKWEVCVYDIDPSENEGVECMQGNIMDVSAVNGVVSLFKPNIVIHLASWGMSGSSMINEEAKAVNIAGTQAVIDACCKGNCPRLIYTSTYNVVFGGQEVAGGDESTQLYPLEKHTDIYSVSKAEAETMILNANNRALSNGDRLLTSCIRPAAIYEEGEQRHFPRIVGHIDKGIYAFQIGDSTTDWVHIDNLVRSSVSFTLPDILLNVLIISAS